MTNIKQTTYKIIADPNSSHPLLGVLIIIGITTVVAVVSTLCALLAYWVFW